jgi:hypothetical protein
VLLRNCIVCVVNGFPPGNAQAFAALRVRVLLRVHGYFKATRRAQTASNISVNPKPPAVENVSGTVPLRVNEALNVGAGTPPTMSVPTVNQSGSKFPFRIHVYRSGKKGAPGLAMGFGADNQ